MSAKFSTVNLAVNSSYPLLAYGTYQIEIGANGATILFTIRGRNVPYTATFLPNQILNVVGRTLKSVNLQSGSAMISPGVLVNAPFQLQNQNVNVSNSIDATVSGSVDIPNGVSINNSSLDVNLLNSIIDVQFAQTQGVNVENSPNVNIANDVNIANFPSIQNVQFQTAQQVEVANSIDANITNSVIDATIQNAQLNVINQGNSGAQQLVGGSQQNDYSGEQYLNITVPAGKYWRLGAIVFIANINNQTGSTVDFSVHARLVLSPTGIVINKEWGSYSFSMGNNTQHALFYTVSMDGVGYGGISGLYPSSGASFNTGQFIEIYPGYELQLDLQTGGNNNSYYNAWMAIILEGVELPL